MVMCNPCTWETASLEPGSPPLHANLNVKFVSLCEQEGEPGSRLGNSLRLDKVGEVEQCIYFAN